MTGYVERLRRLSIGDGRSVADVPEGTAGERPALTLDPRTIALVRVAALVAVDGPGVAFDAAVAVALAAGATPDDVVDTMIAVAPTIGSAHLISVAPKLAAALRYEVGAELEAVDAAAPS
jgi:4-carboxymuconolactone decarboxylase